MTDCVINEDDDEEDKRYDLSPSFGLNRCIKVYYAAYERLDHLFSLTIRKTLTRLDLGITRPQFSDGLICR